MSAGKPVKTVLEEGDISRALTRIAHEIIEKNRGSENLLLLGIPTRGAFLAARLAKIIGSIDKREIPNGVLDITLHRDDLRSRPPRALTPTVIPSSGVEDKIVVLVDDVLTSGATLTEAITCLRTSGLEVACFFVFSRAGELKPSVYKGERYTSTQSKME